MSDELGARFSPRTTKSRAYCSVYGCNSLASKEPTVRFHYFPKSGKTTVIVQNAFGNLEKRDVRKEWERVLKMETIAKYAVVCSLHFKRSDYRFPGNYTQFVKILSLIDKNMILSLTILSTYY